MIVLVVGRFYRWELCFFGLNLLCLNFGLNYLFL